jgi:3-oxoacyl-[acyl-carrier-protein] synthase II
MTGSRVPITGIGVVAPGAVGVGALRELLARGHTAVAPVDRFDTADLTAHTAALVRDFKPRDFIPPMKLRRMNLLSRYAVAAAKLALDDAGASLPSGSGVALGTSFGPVQTSVEYMQEYVEKGAALAPPQLFAESVANAPGSHVAIEHDLRGFNVTFTQREASALAAAMYGAAQIVKGSVPAAILGGVEEVNEMVFSVLDSIGALADVARPFDRRRGGMNIGEGSAIFVADGAARNGAYGYLAGFGMTRDTTATISDWGTGAESVAAAMRAAIDDAGITPEEVDAVYASANGGRRADAVEARGLRLLFSDRMPPVVATKGYFGEYAGGGALQLAAALIAMREQMLHASAGFDEPDDALGITATRESVAAELRHIVVNAVSAGGGNISAVIAREAA